MRRYRGAPRCYVSETLHPSEDLAGLSSTGVLSKTQAEEERMAQVSNEPRSHPADFCDLEKAPAAAASLRAGGGGG